MTIEEYKFDLKRLEGKFNEQKNELIKTYCKANAQHDIGDIASDHIGSIRVEQYKYSLSSHTYLPVLNYYGTVLKKDGTPTKKSEQRIIYGENLKPIPY